jgi:TruD family tRNA pseudouridine synthase
MINPEHPVVKQAMAQEPELFKKPPFVESAEELSKFGIYIPGKESFPEGYIKLYPEDFIVEEIDAEGIVRTIDYENVLSKDSPIPGEGETIYATLVKCGLSTLDVIRDMSAQLHISEKSIGYAGIKDKYAITSQRISIRGASDDAIRALTSANYFFKDLSRGKGAISMTNLVGNRFSIFVRTNPDRPLETIASGEEDFFNYFYLQRFGSPRFMNFRWGYDILRGNYEGAVRSVLFDVERRELPFISRLRSEASQKKSWQEVRDVFEPIIDIMHCESKMLERLIQSPTDYTGALAAVPDQVQLWLYGLASLLFNEKISYSLQKQVPVPHELPFILSFDRGDTDVYREELRSLGIFPPPFHNLRPFPFIRMAHRMTNTSERAKNIEVKTAPFGTFVSFDLPKGAYATTFLSHHINIIGDSLPESISNEKIHGSFLSSNSERAKTIDMFRALDAKEEGEQ